MKRCPRVAIAVLAATVVLCATVNDFSIAQESPKSDFWRAWSISDGQRSKLVVEGVYNNGGPGTVIVMEDALPQGINKNILLLDLKIAKLPGVWPTVLHSIPGYYAKAPYKKGQYTSVQVRYPDGNVVTIEKITDTGKGPE